MNSSNTQAKFHSNETSDSSPRSWVEPSPNWLEAIQQWKWLWEVHVYGFGTIFVLIAFFAMICLAICRKAIFTRHRVHLALMNTALVMNLNIIAWEKTGTCLDQCSHLFFVMAVQKLLPRLLQNW